MNEARQTATCARCGTALAPNALRGLCPRCLMALNLAAATEIPGEMGPSGTKVVKPLPPLDEIARRFPQFEILELLGRGGMGVVYKARQPKLNRIVALKILAPERVAEPKFAERFEREAQALARLNHPNIVTVYDFGEVDGLYYLTMEFVDGMSLRRLLQTRKIEPKEALAIVPKICEALQFAHDEGVVHRDIKPENLLLDKKGRVKIADFGIAKIMGDAPLTPSPSDGERGPERAGEGRLTEGQVVGTPNYMAPEQVEHPQTVDHRADIYSLGVVFYEMLTGELPLGKFQPPSKKVQVDVRLDEVVLHALEKEPELRYQQASQVKTAVETIASTPQTPPAAMKDESLAAVQRRLNVPSIGLMMVGSINLLIFLLGVFGLLAAISSGMAQTQASLGLIPCLLFLFASGLVVLGAVQMRRLGSYGLAIAAGVLAIITPSPFLPLGVCFGLLTLKRLTRPGVLDAFGKAHFPLPESARVKRGGGAWKVAVAVIIALAVPIVALLLAMFIPAISRSISQARTRDDYKLGQNKASRSAQAQKLEAVEVAVPLQSSDALGFGPVIERVVNDLSIGSNCFLNLELGTLLAPTKKFIDMEELRAWSKQHGAVLVAADSRHELGEQGLTLWGGCWTGTESWYGATAEFVVKTTQDPNCLPMSAITAATNSTASFIFKTVRGQMGLLQITGFTDTPRGVKIRYKLVQNHDQQEIRSKITEASVDLGGGINMEFVLIPLGSFRMGSDFADEAPAHKVTFTKPFYLGKFEVTQEQWEAVTGSNPSSFKGPKLPVENVSWEEAQGFLTKLHEKTGRRFALPTEAQWEYACRAGTTTTYSFGDGEADLEEYAWFADNSDNTTHPAGEKKPNPWGLYDMHGNVWERCADWYGGYRRGAAIADPQRSSSGRSHVMRGGAWATPPSGLRSSKRNSDWRGAAHLGLRCVMLVEGTTGGTETLKLENTPAGSSFTVGQKPAPASRMLTGSHRKFVRVVVDKAAMTFEGQPTTWEEVGALLAQVTDRTNTVLECAVTSDQITVQQQDEWSVKCVTLAQPLGFEYVSFIGIHPLGSKGTPVSGGVTSGAAGSLAFGPVIERVVFETTTGRDCFLDLETGRLLQPPPQVMALFAATNWQKQYMNEPEATDPMRAWVWMSGADLVYGSPAFNHERGLILLDGNMMGARDYWKMEAQSVVKSLQEAEGRGRVLGTPSLVGASPFAGADQLPHSHAFRSKDGAMGVLQVIGFTDSPRGVRIRYKLVRTGTPNQSSMGNSPGLQTSPELAEDTQMRADIEKDIPLAEALRQANQQFSDTQPLTEDEVVAAVRNIKQVHPDIPEDFYKTYQRVVNEHVLPRGMYFSHIPGWDTDRGHFKVDWKDLTLITLPVGSKGPCFNYRIRARFIASEAP